MMDVLQGKCEQRYKECEKISLKETYDQVEKHQIWRFPSSISHLYLCPESWGGEEGWGGPGREGEREGGRRGGGVRVLLREVELRPRLGFIVPNVLVKCFAQSNSVIYCQPVILSLKIFNITNNKLSILKFIFPPVRKYPANLCEFIWTDMSDVWRL